MRSSGKRLVNGLYLVLACFVGLVLVWYGYLELKKTSLLQAILASLFFTGGILAGALLLTTKQENPHRWYMIDWEKLGRRQNFLLGTAASTLSLSSLWLVMNREIPVIGGVVGRIVLLTGFFYFGFHAFHNFKRTFRK